MLYQCRICKRDNVDVRISTGFGITFFIQSLGDAKFVENQLKILITDANISISVLEAKVGTSIAVGSGPDALVIS